MTSAERHKMNPQPTRNEAGNAEPAEAPKRVEYLTARQLAEVLQISESTIHKLRRAGKIPAVLLTERLIRFNLKEVKQALRSSQQAASHNHTPESESDPQLSLFEEV